MSIIQNREQQQACSFSLEVKKERVVCFHITERNDKKYGCCLRVREDQRCQLRNSLYQKFQ